MKLRKILFGLILVISMAVVSVVEAKSPDSFNLDVNGRVNANGEILSGWSSDIPAIFTYKSANIGGTNYIALCTGFRKDTTTNGSTYQKSNGWNANVRAGLAAIIINGIGDKATTATVSSTSSDLYFTQVALWKFIQQEVGTNQELTYTLDSCSQSQLQTVNNLYEIGETAKARYDKINNFAITLDATKLDFTLNGDTYESQVVKVSGEEIKTVTPSVNKGTVTEKNGGYVVTVKKDQLSSEGDTITLTFNATSNTILVASNYSNGNNNEQTVTITVFDEFSKTASKSINGSIDEETPNYIYISKQDATTGEELPDAELVLTDANGNVIDSWTSGITPHKVEKVLAAGKYTLSETMAPEGYEKTTETVTFTVKEDGTVDKQVIMYNKPKEVPYSPPTGTSTFMFILMGSFVLFAIAFYYYAGYKVKKQM